MLTFFKRTFEFGDFEQTQNTTVFLVTTKQTLVLLVEVNTWKRVQTFPKKCSPYEYNGNTKWVRTSSKVHIHRPYSA